VYDSDPKILSLQVTIESATQNAAAAQNAIKNVMSEFFLDRLRDQGFSAVRFVSSMAKVSIFPGIS
jgi:hypothetical protein